MKRTTVRLLIFTCVAALAAAALVLLLSPDPGYRFRAWCALGDFERHDALINAVALKHGLDGQLVKAIVWRESTFDAGKIHNGAYGLMQLGEDAGVEWAWAEGVETFMTTDLLDPNTNLEAGCWYLAHALAQWRHGDDTLAFALAEYHAGTAAVQRWARNTDTAADFLRAIDTPGTRDFVSAVLHRRGCYAAP